MFIWLVLFLLIGSQALFSISFTHFSSAIGWTIGAIQFALFAMSIVLMRLNFRRSRTTNYKKAFNSMGLLIATGVPTLGFFLFGIAYELTGMFAFLFIGWGISCALFIAILIGIQWGRWNWKVRSIQLEFENLPEHFDGTKIVQISDIHIGSFFNRYDKVQKAIEMINELEADYVLFTGDLVNNIAEEMEGWEGLFSTIKAKKGKFSILGNHDYGDYVAWEVDAEKSANLEKVITIHQEIGFKPLLNSAVLLSDYENEVWLLGVENWGKAPFRQSGKLQETLALVPENAFKILLSHDPSHFDEQVIGTDISLTLSGHTHGMQFGIERFGIKWSPVSFRYPRWAGLYNVGKQFLYVNRGFGYIGFPGRVGIYPEITEIVLKKKKDLNLD